MDGDEAKSFFEANYSHIFYILHETFVQAEANLKQRGEFRLTASMLLTNNSHSSAFRCCNFFLIKIKELSFHIVGKSVVAT